MRMGIGDNRQQLEGKMTEKCVGFFPTVVLQPRICVRKAEYQVSKGIINNSAGEDH